jgi:hypothetical protein
MEEYMHENIALLKATAEQIIEQRDSLTEQIKKVINAALGGDIVNYVHIAPKDGKVEFQVFGSL